MLGKTESWPIPFEWRCHLSALMVPSILTLRSHLSHSIPTVRSFSSFSSYFNFNFNSRMRVRVWTCLAERRTLTSHQHKLLLQPSKWSTGIPIALSPSPGLWFFFPYFMPPHQSYSVLFLHISYFLLLSLLFYLLNPLCVFNLCFTTFSCHSP